MKVAQKMLQARYHCPFNVIQAGSTPSTASDASQLFATAIRLVCMADIIAGTIFGQTTIFESWSFELCIYLHRPSSMSIEAWLTLESQLYGSTAFNTLHPLINSNFRVKEEEKQLLIPIRDRTWVATIGEGPPPSRRSKIRVSGRAAANFVRYDLVASVDTSSSRTCSALDCGFVSSIGDIIERGEIAPEGLDATE